jgi:two-component system cell cycle response regulator
MALMMLDIDFFKSINDTYGHDAGDDVLREFAVRVRKSIRGIDSPAAMAARNSSS